MMKDLVDRFLTWPLPAGVCSDLCATMQNYPHRTGTTLLTATEAEQMLEHVVGPSLKEVDELKAENEKLKNLVDECIEGFEGHFGDQFWEAPLGKKIEEALKEKG